MKPTDLVIHDCTPPVGHGGFLALQAALPEWPTPDEYRAAFPAIAKLLPGAVTISDSETTTAAGAAAFETDNHPVSRSAATMLRAAHAVGLVRLFSGKAGDGRTTVVAINEDGTRGAVMFDTTATLAPPPDGDEVEAYVSNLGGINGGI